MEAFAATTIYDMREGKVPDFFPEGKKVLRAALGAGEARRVGLSRGKRRVKWTLRLVGGPVNGCAVFGRAGRRAAPAGRLARKPGCFVRFGVLGEVRGGARGEGLVGQDVTARSGADRFTYLYSATVLGVAFLLLVYVGQYMEMVEIQVQISRHQAETRKLEDRIDRLLVRRAELARLERLEFAAQERLGLVLPGQGNVRYLPVTDIPAAGDPHGSALILSHPDRGEEGRHGP